MTLIYLVEITAGVAGSPIQRTLRVASAPLGYNNPTAPAYYAPHLIEAANIRRAIVAPRRTFGASEIGVGEVRVMNIDGVYDEWFDFGYGFDSRVLIGDHTDDYGDFTVVLTGKVEQPSGNKDEIIFRFRDRQIELDRLVSPVAYLGTNSGTTGTEGNANDIKGQSKIRVFGEVFNITPDAINANDRLYGVNHTKAGVLDDVNSITMRLNGSAWTLAGNDADIATLQAASISQGNYRTSLANGALRLGGSAPAEGGAITCDVIESSTGSVNQIASIIERLLLDAGVASGDIDVRLDDSSPSFAAWTAGLLIRDETYRTALDTLCGNSAIWYCPNRLGVYQVRRFDVPSNPVAGFKKFDYPNVAAATDYEIRDLERIVTNDEGRGVPAWRITVNYKRMWTVQDRDGLAAAISDDDRELYSREYRSVTVTNEAIRDQYPEAVELEFNTVLTRESDATLLANHLLDLYGVQRSMYRLTARYNVPIAQAIDLGDTITVTHNRYGLQSGRDFVITAMRYNAQKYEIELELWG